jgi:Tol biopolymer transport system component
LILSRPKIDEFDFELDEVALADGSLRKLPFGQNGMSPVISPNGDKLAYVTYSAPDSDHADIWRKDLLKPQSPAVKLISSTHQQITPAYSPDGKYIAFESTRGGAREIWMSDADGTHLVQISNFKHPVTGTPRWSPDSQKIVFDTRQSEDSELYIVDVSELMPRKVATNVPNISMPSWSHDGKWIYFFSESLDGAKVYRCPANGGDAVLLAALPRGERGGIGPVESFDGKSVYFAKRIYDTELYTVSLERAGSASVLKGMPLMKYAFLWTVAPGGVYFVPAGAPKSLRYFDFSTKQVRQIFEIDKEFFVGLSVSPDGRWLLYTQVEAEENSDIMLVENFR